MKDESDSCVLVGAGRNKIGTKLFIILQKWAKKIEEPEVSPVLPLSPPMLPQTE